MSENNFINLKFDRYSLPVEYSIVEKFILKELHRLSKETGYSIKNLTVEFKINKRRDTVAYFTHTDHSPIGFCFYINMLDNVSANKIIDVCRHEFAHYITFMQNRGKVLSDVHGSAWKKVCKNIGAFPSALMHNNPTKHFI